MNLDKPYFWCIELIAAMRSRGYKIFFVTGRDEDYRNMTESWLKIHNVIYDELYRENQKTIVKTLISKEIYLNHIEKKNSSTFCSRR